MIDRLCGDLRYAFRTLRRSRAATAITILTLSLGIGAVTSLFAVVDAVILRPLLPDQHRVVHISKADAQRDNFPVPLSLHEAGLWRDQSRSFEALAAVDHAATGRTPIAIDGTTAAVQLAPVSAEFFQVVTRDRPLAGRWLERADEHPGGDVAAVVSERFWRRVSSGDPSLVGRGLSWAGDRTLRIVGIAPASIDYPLGTDIWAPAAAVFDGKQGRFDAANRTFAQFELLGRLSTGVSIDAARAELSVIHRRIAADFPNDYRPLPVVVEPVSDVVLGSGRRVLLVLFAAASLVFVIAAVNVAALLLIRAWDRRHEFAVREALGAGRSHLWRQALAESAMLATAGVAGGLLVANGVIRAAQWLAPGEIPRLDDAAIDPRAIAFCGGAALVWIATVGTLPAWLGGIPLASRQQSFRVTRRTTVLIALTVTEIAAAIVVTIGAGLLVKTYSQMQAIERGFEPDHLLLMSLLLPEAQRRDRQAMLELYDRLLPEIESIPGVRAASPVHVGPGSGALGLSAPMLFEGQTAADAATNPWSTWEPVLPSYFRAIGVPIVRGRAFTADDRNDGAPVAIISQSVAQRYWPGQDPLGKRLRFVETSDWPWVTVVGVAADTRYRELTKRWMTVYFPAPQFFFFEASTLAVRVTSNAVVPAITQRIRAIEPAAAIDRVTPMTTLLSRELARPLTAFSVASGFAVLAVTLAAIGVYGAFSDNVRQRRRELAVRSAIGAHPADLFRDVLKRSAFMAAVGLTIGLTAAAAGMRLLQSMLYEVQPLDPMVFAAATGALLCIVLFATFFPARLAARTDPVAALRAD